MAKKSTESKRRPGPPSAFSKARVLRIFERMINGESDRAASRAEGVSWGSFCRWKRKTQEIASQYARAREDRDAWWESELIEVYNEIKTAESDPENGRIKLDSLKLRLDYLKWYLSKRLPKQYGDRAALEVTGSEGEPLMPQRTRPEMEEFAAILAAAQARVRGDDNGTG